MWHLGKGGVRKTNTFFFVLSYFKPASRELFSNRLHIVFLFLLYYSSLVKKKKKKKKEQCAKNFDFIIQNTKQKNLKK